MSGFKRMECPNCKTVWSDNRDLPRYKCDECGEWFDGDSKPVPTLLGKPLVTIGRSET